MIEFVVLLPLAAFRRTSLFLPYERHLWQRPNPIKIIRPCLYASIYDELQAAPVDLGENSSSSTSLVAPKFVNRVMAKGTSDSRSGLT